MGDSDLGFDNENWDQRYSMEICVSNQPESTVVSLDAVWSICNSLADLEFDE